MIKIPARWQPVLKLRQDLDGVVNSTLARFAPILQRSHFVFFPEYTDHGIDHVQSVLNTCDWLITDEAFSALGPEDFATLTLAVLTHDLGMLLEYDGFRALIADDSVPPAQVEKSIFASTETTWSELWNDYLREAMRWNAPKRIDLFGVDSLVRPPPTNPNEPWDDFQILLVGEFLRRYHPRLGHEIALWGMQGLNNQKLEFDGPHEFRDLVGFVGRSHGQSLRDCVDELEDIERDYALEMRDSHPVYLMALVRIADYIQIQADRAPKSILKIKSLTSPYSEGEWRTHQDTIAISLNARDPEAIRVEANPRDVQIFLKLKSLLSGIQTELDRTWAVLGEVYGHHQDLNGFSRGMRLRRIRSNLDNNKKFAQQVSYLPEHVKFETADSELLRLLVEPLYGDRPDVGIRELLQNSVDACNELEIYLQNHPEYKSRLNEINPQETDILLEIKNDGKQNVIEISDRGIGMTADVIKNYFFRIGISYRVSDHWKQEFEDSDGNSRVSRIGRFGIGILAAFLLGEQIEVTTRHISESSGWNFTFGINDPHIQIHRAICSVGTKIKVSKNSESVVDYLTRPSSFDNGRFYCLDWYVLLKPSLETIVFGEKTYGYFQVPPKSYVDPFWRHFVASESSEVSWAFDSEFESGIFREFSVNGIKIDEIIEGKRSEFGKISVNFGIKKFKGPTLNVNESKNSIKLNLQRDRLVEELPFIDEIEKNIILDYFSFLFSIAEIVSESNLFSERPYLLRYPGIDLREEMGFYFDKLGIYPIEPEVLRKLGKFNLVSQIFFLEENNNVSLENREDLTNLSNSVFGMEFLNIERRFHLDEDKLVYFNYLFIENEDTRNLQRHFSNFYLTSSNNAKSIRRGHRPSAKEHFSKDLFEISQKKRISIKHTLVPQIDENKYNNFFYDLWIRYVGETPIPFEENARKKIIDGLTSEILENIDKHKRRIEIRLEQEKQNIQISDAADFIIRLNIDSEIFSLTRKSRIPSCLGFHPD
jgi:molecular chaperone HtpG